MNWFPLCLSLALVSSDTVANQDTDFNWLRDDSRSSAQVLDYLKQHNSRSDAYFSEHHALTGALLQQWSDTAATKASKPWVIRGEFEYGVVVVDGQRTLIERHRNGGEQRSLLNLDQRDDALDYYQLGAWSLSPDGQSLALAEDISGSGEYRVSVLSLATGQESQLPERWESYLQWSGDSKALYLIGQETHTLRPDGLYRLALSSPQPKRLWHETDSGWLMSMYRSANPNYVVIQSNSELATEQRLLNLKDGTLSPALLPRQQGIDYYADVAGDALYLNSNHQGEFALYQAPLTQPEKLSLLYRPQKGQQLDNYYLFKAATVAVTKLGPKRWLQILSPDGTLVKSMAIGEANGVAWVSRNGDYASNRLRIRSMSMITPPKWRELNLTDLSWQTLSQDHYPHFNADLYHSEQIQVDSGHVKVTVTLAYRKDAMTATSPVILYGYGAYGVTMRPYFMPQIISLLDRGAIYAVAHVRGGGYLGEPWHQDGIGANKQHAISDYLASAKALRHFNGGDHPIGAIGGSAGGTLVAAALNQDVNLFDAVVLQVPFVDVLASMSDSSLPLSSQQHQEWGNPAVPEQLEFIKAYDPISNLRPLPYPPMLVRVGLNDRRVPYWEGAKYLSRLEAISTGQGPYLLSTDFAGGHSSDHRNASEQQAREYAFLLMATQSNKRSSQ
ncbi:prolyl oligopeptidase family serine peptidase [Ferrimonas sp. SCSIO 43195]|uniref:prolyl oligopeptidase family serine peptidase n=1 Tax=Ferrimonas sp. SCSIO 43195 TaxID=2822844 RepID=UPI0020764059|nr:prolyl oligopeptidase family serine peptidase [Ferrimonas sp. SCSIO 43195]USD35876.1 S9 family peptidase [Ferrimonas sp. SCSIO 43195]